MDFDVDVPGHVRMNSLRIAVRVMLNSEALDFYMDPRGIVPQNIGRAIHSIIGNQMLFIAGHEFAHYILGHLNPSDTTVVPIYSAIFCGQEDFMNPYEVYNIDQKKELEADVSSVSMLESSKARVKILRGGLMWFLYLHLYEQVVDSINPRSYSKYCTHPSAIDRYENLLSSFSVCNNLSFDNIKRLKDKIYSAIPVVLEDVSVNIDAYETYGSAYLDKPNTEWRGRELVDRVDYY